MSTDSRNEELSPTPSAPGDGEQASPEPVEVAAQPIEQPVEQKPEPQAEVARLRDQLLRTAADFDNFRKRSRREQEDAQRRGREGVIKDLLPVFDNLERAVLHAEGSSEVKAVAEGLRIVLKQFLDTLDKMGVKRVPAVGQPFDPQVHEAIQHMESPDYPAGVVMAEVQPGYAMGDRLIRASMVVVSKGPPAAN